MITGVARILKKVQRLPFFISIYKKGTLTMLPNSNEATPQTPAGGTEQTPASSPSGAQSQPLPDYVTALQSQVAELKQAFRTTQGSADAQFAQVRGDIKRILELKEQGLNESQIQRELWIDSQMAPPPAQNAPVQQVPGKDQPNTSLDVENVVKSLQFPENDPTLAALRIRYANDPNGFVKAAAEVRIAQATSPNPSPATLPSLSGKTPQPEGLEALNKEYQERKKNIPRGNVLGLSELQAEFRKRGLNV